MMRIAVMATMAAPLTAACVAVVDLGDDDVVLTTFAECGSLLDHLRSEYAERVGPWGFGSRPSIADIGETRLEPTDDLFETDGHRIFTVSKGRLTVVDAASRQIEGSARLASEYATELLFDGDDLLVILNDRSPPVRFALKPADGSPADGSPAADQSASPAGEQPAGYDQPVVTVVQRVRVDGYTPRVVETLRIDGANVSTHSIDGVARVVTHHDPSWSVPFSHPNGSASEQEAEEANRAAILAGTLEDWLPSYAVGPGGGRPPVGGGLLADCENVYVPSVFAGFGVITVMSLPVGGPLAGNDAMAVMTSGDIVHATPRSLYVATSAWVDPELLEDYDARRLIIKDRRTAVHRFDLTDPARAAYTASDTVLGRIHDQSSLSRLVEMGELGDSAGG